MMEAFSPPSWTRELTEEFTAAAGPEYEVVQVAADRHGSWEWVAQARDDEDLLLTSLVTPLSPPRDDDEIPSGAVVVAWQGSAEADEIDPKLVRTKRLRNLSGQDGFRRLAEALGAAVRAAAIGQPSSGIGLLRQRFNGLDGPGAIRTWIYLVALSLNVAGIALVAAGAGRGWAILLLTLPAVTGFAILGAYRDAAPRRQRSKIGV
jgi:hypothetical protein